jgi:hypothetical protein
VGVLGGEKISSRLQEIFGETGDPDAIRAAKYYLTLGEDLLILPNGDRVWGKGNPRRRRSFTLNPGDTALVSTKERLSVPLDLAGIFGPTFALSNGGIFFFGGMLVDPGFGCGRDGKVGPKDPLPLTFYLANVGASSIQLKPGEDHIASISFLPVEGSAVPPTPRYLRPTDPKAKSPSDRMREEREEIFLSKEPPGRALGLVSEVTEIGKSLDKLEASVNQVVLFGVILLATTLVAIMTTLALDKDPGAPSFKSMDWLETSATVGVVVVEIAILVGLFYLSVLAAARIFGLRKRKSHLSR